MREQILVGMLTLAFAVGFIFSIEGLAQNSRNILEPCACLASNKEACLNSSAAEVLGAKDMNKSPEPCSNLNQNYAWGY
ncbi:hypothetical protein [Bdellovibrio reynosensis]|uniref:Uncharacterized protein n=1 Tax=Bdellovibrio reynosensis TaxID=2835041 RepID=A0ABY4C6N9_9BACT|nr:hypothetical protein [Bdellovibrio reynosensis]UOF00570.1 hypothetical protein MNR06_12760 [Bdellovibrio reynosensis]